MRTKKPKKTFKEKWEEAKADPKKFENYRKYWAINAIRKAGYRWPGRYNCSSLNKLARNEYFCNICGIIGGRRDFNLDHIIPVVSEAGFQGFDSYIERHFVKEEGFQRICSSCHDEKSQAEGSIRRKKKK